MPFNHDWETRRFDHLHSIRKITVTCNLYSSNVSPREREFLSWQTHQLAFLIRTNLRPHRPKCKEVCSTSHTKIERPTSGLTNINRLKDDRWTSRVTTWRPYDKKRRQGDQPSGGETTWTNTGATLYAEDSTRQVNLETAC